MNTRKCLLSVPALLLALLAGCAIGPDYQRPSVAAPAFKSTDHWQPAAPTAELPRGKWWEAFGDPVLNGLEDRVEVSSNTLAIAQAQYQQVLDSVASVYSALYPALDVTGSADRSRAAGKNGVPGQIQNNFGAGLAASWELDLWGTVRRGLEAGRATAEASAADLESARLSLHATLAQTYFSLRVADTQVELYARTVADYEKSLQITRNRYAQGVDTRGDVASAEAQLKTAQAQAIDLQLTRLQLEHALAVILGVPPADFSLAPASLTLTPPPAPALIPSQQLERRPDIAGAERRLAAASAGIGIAQGGYFPQISLTGSAGYQGNVLRNLFSAPNEIWAVGGSFAAPLFNAGKTGAQVAQARAAYDQGLATYRQTVLAAFQEVEDNLAATIYLAGEAAVQDEAVVAARLATTIARNQYAAGTVTYLDVITAQTTQLDAERTAVQLLGRRLTSSLTLLKAAGGDWRQATAKP
ncbi:MAG: efflux transporter outer membrane subunit [Opitutales bacterium]